MNLKWEDNGLVVNYSKLYVNNNLWKIQLLGYDREDFLQECFIVYFKCLKNFTGQDDALFFSYFKKSLEHLTTSLSRKCEKERLAIEGVKERTEDQIIDSENEAMFRLKLDEAPVAIKNFLRKAIDNRRHYGNRKQIFNRAKEYLLER